MQNLLQINFKFSKTRIFSIKSVVFFFCNMLVTVCSSKAPSVKTRYIVN